MAKRVTAAGPVEGPWALPDGWRWDRIDNVAPVNPRRGPDRLADETEVAFVPMAAVQAETGVIDVSARRPVSSVRQGFTRFGTGDVIFAKITPCMENGKIAIIPAIPAGSGFGSTEFHVMSPLDVTSRYLYYWVSQRGFRETAEFNMTGTAGQKRVPTDFMRDALIPVPSVDVQNTVVARIDELFAEIDDGEAALARARDDLATWRKALLKAAVTGELTADWRTANPPTETGADLLARILAERRARWDEEPGNKGKRYKEPAAADVAVLPPLPTSWTWATAEQVVRKTEYGTSIKCSGEPSGPPVLRMGNIQDGGLDWHKLKYAPLGSPLPILQPGDVLFNRTNSAELLGKSAVFDGADEPVSFASYIVAVRLAAVLPHFFSAWMNSIYGREWVAQNKSQQVGQANLSAGTLMRMPVPVPPAAEQQRITELIAADRDRDDALGEDLHDLALAGQTLRQSILAAAFRGELK